MSLRNLPRQSFDVALRASLWPLDRAARRSRRHDQSISGAELALDHADAALRGLAAWILRDSGMRQDALRRLEDMCRRAHRLRRDRPGDADRKPTDELTAKRRQKRQRMDAV